MRLKTLSHWQAKVVGTVAMKLLIFIFAFSWALTAEAAVPKKVQDLFARMEQKNREVRLVKLNERFKKLSVQGAKSSHYFPSLSLSGTTQKGDGQSASIPSGSTGQAPQQDGLETPDASYSGDDYDFDGGGWAASASLGYFLFTKFAISENLRRARNDLKSAKMSSSQELLSKRAHLLQGIIEWQNLKEIEEPLIKATELVSGVRKFSKGRAKILYAVEDQANLDEKEAAIEYNRLRVQEGIRLLEAGLVNLVPDLKLPELNEIPKLAVDYPLAKEGDLEPTYKSQSYAHKMNQLTIDSAKGYQNAAEWDRPWIPVVYWSASHSTSGDYKGNSDNGSTSTSLIASFNVFDGFYADARRQQARIATKVAEEKSELEREKKVLYLKYQRMNALVAKAEYKHKDAIARKKQIRYKDIQRKYRGGIGTKLEVSLGSLAFAKAKLEAIDKLKAYQRALLDIAVELNDWKRVKIYEKTK
jgi:outer membrane protein TolC